MSAGEDGAWSRDLETEIVSLPAEAFLERKEAIVDVYRAAFSPPPYRKSENEVRQFRGSLQRHVGRQGFRCRLARQERGALAGFAYGYTARRGLWWYDVVSAQMDEEMKREWLSDPFELVELAVRPERQGRGFGGRLHDDLLTGLPHSTALLSTLDAETAAWHLYRHRGWRVLLDDFHFPNVPRPYVIMGLRLSDGEGDRDTSPERVPR